MWSYSQGFGAWVFSFKVFWVLLFLAAPSFIMVECAFVSYFFVVGFADCSLDLACRRVLSDVHMLTLLFSLMDRDDNASNALVCKLWAEHASLAVWGCVDMSAFCSLPGTSVTRSGAVVSNFFLCA